MVRKLEKSLQRPAAEKPRKPAPIATIPDAETRHPHLTLGKVPCVNGYVETGLVIAICVADDAVHSELVCGRISLFYREITGKLTNLETKRSQEGRK